MPPPLAASETAEVVDDKPIIAVRKRPTRAAEYRSFAAQAQALADASELDHVREKHRLAAARWEDLAVMDEQSHAERLAHPTSNS